MEIEKDLKTKEVLEVMANAYAMCDAMQRLVEAGEQRTARIGIRQIWKTILKDDRSIARHAAELVVDEFFNTDGDMSSAVKRMREDLFGVLKLPESLRDKLFDQIETMTKDYLATMREWAKRCDSNRHTPTK